MSDSLYLTLQFNEKETPIKPEEPGDFAYEISGRVSSVEDDDRRTQVGRFRVYYIDVDAALEAGHAPYDVLDYRSQTAGYMDPLFTGDDGWATDGLIKLMGEENLFHSNVLILDRLEILSEFRGRGIGLVVLRRLIERFSAGTGVVAMKPYPLQFEAVSDVKDSWRDQLGIEKLSKDRKASFAKLQLHYARLGFKRLAKSELMFRATEQPLPDFDSLIPARFR